EWVHVQLHQQKGMISLSPPTICNSAPQTAPVSENSNAVVIQYQDKPYVRLNGGDWVPYPQ
ncbi:cellulose biosynthesis protein BcsG, partial [Escherichia coli]|uniref:cellulose biosynthesis protein BcsG n=1 Tax=Escherichia coli TaxID=562 RepID=UPI002860F9CA